jgi:radical SAM superfamily enzyme YgiQ (UPF0313 family)
MRISFINPPFKPRFSREQRSPAVTKSGTLYYPHWLAYAASYARFRGHAIDLFDGCATPVDFVQVVDHVKRFEANIAILDTSTPSIYNDMRCASAIKEQNPSVRVFLVGPHISATVQEGFRYMRENGLKVDGILLGEYDQIVVDVAERLATGQDIRKTPGLAYQIKDVVFENPKPPLLEKLDGWPMVTELYKEFLDINAYYYGHNKHPMVTIITGRGCPYKCTFCQLPQVVHGHDYRTRSAEDVVREFRYISQELPHVRNIMIEDDTFTADKHRVRVICRHLIEEGLTGIEWTCNARADVDSETLHYMRRAGCRMLCVGFESGDQEILNKMRKGTKLGIVEKFVRDAKEAGVMVHGCFMFGNKFETKESMERTLEFALRLPLDTAQFFPIMVSPGTADYEFFKHEGMLSTEDFSAWNDAEGNHLSTINRPNLSNEYIEAFCDTARRKFYGRPRYLAYKAKQSLSDWNELKRNLMGFRVLVKHLVSRKGVAQSV